MSLPTASRRASSVAAITDEHLLMNVDRASELHQARVLSLDHPAAGLENTNAAYQEVLLCDADALRACMPLTFALTQSRGDWSSLANNVRIKVPVAATSSDDPASPTPADSWMQLRLPLSTDAAVFHRYRLFQTDRVRLGKLLEDFDALAADVAYKHLGVGSVDKYIIVTAAMDRLDLRAPVSRATDVIISGGVTSVGSTSLDVRLWVEAESVDASGALTRALIMQAVFSMVCRHKATYAAAQVPKLRVVTAYDQWAVDDGIARRAHRKHKSERDLKRAPPTPDEIALIHSLHLAAGGDAECDSDAAPPLAHSQTCVSTMEVMHVQERNVHNKIFGGTLMRMALELATTCAFNTCSVFPVLIAMDDVTFLAPVEIGSLLALRACAPFVCAAQRWCFVAVDAHMINTSSRTVVAGGQLAPARSKLTNQFHFVFRVDAQHALPRIRPETYAEMLAHVDARRRERELCASLARRTRGADAVMGNEAAECAVVEENAGGAAPA